MELSITSLTQIIDKLIIAQVNAEKFIKAQETTLPADFQVCLLCTQFLLCYRQQMLNDICGRLSAKSW